MAKIKCPMCEGCGEINPPHLKQKILKEKIKTAKSLKDSGYSIREIMRIMNYKSPRSVQDLLNS